MYCTITYTFKTKDLGVFRVLTCVLLSQLLLNSYVKGPSCPLNSLSLCKQKALYLIYCHVASPALKYSRCLVTAQNYQYRQSDEKRKWRKPQCLVKWECNTGKCSSINQLLMKMWYLNTCDSFRKQPFSLTIACKCALGSVYVIQKMILHYSSDF